MISAKSLYCGYVGIKGYRASRRQIEAKEGAIEVPPNQKELLLMKY
jgi:hypothetical protein